MIKNIDFGFSQSGFKPQPTNYWLCDRNQFLNPSFFICEKKEEYHLIGLLRKYNGIMVVKHEIQQGVWNMLHFPKTVTRVVLRSCRMLNLIVRRLVISIPEILLVKSHLPDYLYGTQEGSTYYQTWAVLYCYLDSRIKAQGGHVLTLWIWQKGFFNI